MHCFILFPFFLKYLTNAESDNNKILYETLLDFFLKRNGTYFLNKPRKIFTFYVKGALTGV